MHCQQHRPAGRPPRFQVKNVIAGAVINFTDISDSVTTRLALKKANELLRLAIVVRDGFDAITVHDLQGRTLAWNPASVALCGWTEAKALALNFRDRLPPALHAEAQVQLYELSRAEVQERHQTQRLTKDGRSIDVRTKATALLGDDGQIHAIATTEQAASAQPGAAPGSARGPGGVWRLALPVCEVPAVAAAACRWQRRRHADWALTGP